MFELGQALLWDHCTKSPDPLTNPTGASIVPFYRWRNRLSVSQAGTGTPSLLLSLTFFASSAPSPVFAGAASPAASLASPSLLPSRTLERGKLGLGTHDIFSRHLWGSVTSSFSSSSLIFIPQRGLLENTKEG